MAARMSEIGMSAVRASEIGMRHSAANLQMMVGTVAHKAHGIATILTRSTSRGRKRELKTTSTTAAEDDESPLSQIEDISEPEEDPGMESAQMKHEEQHDDQQEKKPLLPWEVRGDDGETRENVTVKEKVLEVAVFRRTFVEPADGEEEYIFDYAELKDAARELLLSNPNLREKREILVEAVPVAVVTEEVFWRNFFLRCNAIRVAEGLPSYLPEVEQAPIPTGAFARLRRGLFGKKKRPSSTKSSKQRRGLLGGRSGASDSPETVSSEVDLGDLELDIDGEIEKELVKRRPSRAVEMHKQPVLSSKAPKVDDTTTAHTEEPEGAGGSDTKKSEDSSACDAQDAADKLSGEDNGSAVKSAESEYTPILV